jgi:hypothetical protein
MIIERTGDEIIIRLSAKINTDDLQEFVNYARYKELTSTFQTDQTDVDKLASEINKSWWQSNRDRLIK